MKKILAKKILPIFILIIALVAFNGCSNSESTETPKEIASNSLYKITEANGQRYINFHDGNETSKSQLGSIKFDSIAELKSKIESGSFTEEQINIIKSAFPKDENGGIIICNTDKLYDAILPLDLSVDGIGWSGGEGYTFYLKSEQNEDNYFHYMEKSYFDNRLKNEYTDFFSKDNITVKSTATTSERNAKITEYSTSQGDLRQIDYTLNTVGKTLTIVETYCLRMNHDLIKESEMIPYSIYIYGTESGVCFIATLYNLEERPSEEWLLSFGIKDYVPAKIN